MNKRYWLYIMASKQNGTLYIGMTSNLAKRIWGHKSGEIDGFSQKYGTKMLVYYEEHDTPDKAITREKNMKKWKRLWKIRLIEELNPHWKDLYDELCV